MVTKRFFAAYRAQLMDPRPPSTLSGILGESLARPTQVVIAGVFVMILSDTNLAQVFGLHRILSFTQAFTLCAALRAACTGYIVGVTDLLLALNRITTREKAGS